MQRSYGVPPRKGRCSSLGARSMVEEPGHMGSDLVIWSAGIGPVGKLVAQGAIDRGERVVVADFRGGTEESLADAIPRALRADL